MTARSPRNSARSWLPLLPAVLLLLVAAGQVYLATRGSLTPWKGGGFGMFSTNDRPDSRRVRAWVSSAGGSEEIEISADLANLVFLLATLWKAVLAPDFLDGRFLPRDFADR